MLKHVEEESLKQKLLWPPMLIVAWAFRVFVLMRTWGWFMVPLGVQPLSFWWASGINLLLVHAFPHPYNSEKSTRRRAFDSIALSMLVLFFGGLTLKFL